MAERVRAKTLQCAVVVLDIEGTTSAARHVLDVLFPYSRAELPRWVEEHRADPEVAGLLSAVAAQAACSPDDLPAIVGQLQAWIDADVKAPELKAIQGHIWDAGYAAGKLTTHLFPDVEGALRTWHGAGVEIAVYSSGSVRAQQSWFRHAPGGDLTPLMSANFDLETAGPKREAASYERIATALGRPPHELCFLSDIEAEISAAREAGWQAVGVLREGETQATAQSAPLIHAFDELDLEPPT